MKLLKKNINNKNLHSIDSAAISINLQMLKLKRIDYLIGLPTQKKELSLRNIPDEYLFYNISEINKYVPMYTHCSNSVIGRKIISKLNKLLTQEYLLDSIDSYENWYGKNTDFKKNFLSYIVQGKILNSVRDLATQ